jgi:methylamine--corrinoid protein Co-methyltransferase
MEDMDWYMGLYRKMKELEKRYNLTYPKASDDPVLLDGEQRTDYFRAALDFIVDNGIFCVETHRVLKFTEDEIRDDLREVPRRSVVGEGAETRIIEKRPFDSAQPHPIVGGGLHAPIRQDLTNYVPQVFARIPRVDYLEGFTFAEVDGYEIYGPAIEAYASRREMAWMREGVRKAGRPGLSITYYLISTRASTLIAPMDPEFGLRRCDGILFTVLPGVMVNYDYITASIVYEQYGLSHRRNLGGGGGDFAAGPIGELVGFLATAMAGWLIYHDNHQMASLLPLAQILDDKTNMIRFGLYATNAGCLGLKGMLRLASESMRQTVAGNTLVSGGLGRVESMTPTEVSLVAEVADATAKSGLHVRDAYEISNRFEDEHGVKEFFKQFEGPVAQRQFLTGWDGQDYGFGNLRTNYDLSKMTPAKEHHLQYIEARKILINHGLKLD